MQAGSIQSDEFALERVFEAAECRTQVELAAFLGIRQSSISDAKKRQSIPAEWLVKLLLRKGIHPEWILSGKGARFMRPAEVSAATQTPSADMQTLLRTCPACQLAAELVRRCGERQNYPRKRWLSPSSRKPGQQER